MSRAYRIAMKESLTRDLAASDEVCSDLEILQILPREQMAELLRGELIGRGFEQTEDGKLVRQDDDITVRVDPETGEVSVKAEAADQVKLESEREDWAFDDVGPSEQVIRDKLKKDMNDDLERKASQQQKQLQNQATEKLEGHLDDVRKELSQAVNRITAEALKRKAASLGRIKEMSEDPQSGSLTITVEV